MFWRWLLEAIALIVAWLVVVSAAAAQQQLPNFQQFNPEKFLDQFFGKGDANDDARLAKVQVSWEEEQRLGQQTLDELKQRLAAKKATIIERGRDVEYLQRLANLIQPQMQQAQRYRKLKVSMASLAIPEAVRCPAGGSSSRRECSTRPPARRRWWACWDTSCRISTAGTCCGG